jgi:epoxyqueuosine reductase
MESKEQIKAEFNTNPGYLVEKEIKDFTANSELNLMPETDQASIFDQPLVGFADGNDPLFTQYKSIIASTHLTPVEALAKTHNKNPEDLKGPISVISWILPITEKTRQSVRKETQSPSRLWAYTRWHGEKFNDALRRHLVGFLSGLGYLAAAPAVEPYFKASANEKGAFSNWSERHIAFTAGHGTFSLSDGFITDRGIAHRCGSVVTDLQLPASTRIANGPYSNCLFYINGSCKACISRCPAGAITEKGHDKKKCMEYSRTNLGHLKEIYNVGIAGCGLCQVGVPCEFNNPARRIKNTRS